MRVKHLILFINKHKLKHSESLVHVQILMEVDGFDTGLRSDLLQWMSAVSASL